MTAKSLTHSLAVALFAMVPLGLFSGTTLVRGAVLADRPLGLARHCADVPIEVDVVVVGGGFSGMMSAYELYQAGLKTVVLEAKEALGGRSRTVKRRSGPGILELGATWINKQTQPEVFALTQKFRLETAAQYVEGVALFQGPDGRVLKLTADLPVNTDDEETAILELQMYNAIGEAAKRADLRRFDTFPAEEDVTFQAWLATRNFWDHPHLKAVAGTVTSSLVGREPHEVGAQYIFDYVKSGGGLEELSTEGELGAQSLKIKQGTTAIVTSMADALAPGSVHINTPAESITQSNGTVLVRTTTGSTFRARKVILAIPTNTYQNITFSPDLPCKKNAVVSRTKPGIYAKLILSYAEPWWRKAGLVGKFTSTTGPVCFSWDTSDPSFDQHSLAIFVAGANAERWRALPDDAARTKAVGEHLASMVGDGLADAARNTLEIHSVDWTEEAYIGGAPTSAMGPGLLRKYGASLRPPFGNVHFGGAEMAYEWKGYLEGAIRAGQNAARQVIDALGE